MINLLSILNCCSLEPKCENFKLICYVVLRRENNTFLFIFLGIEFRGSLIKQISRELNFIKEGKNKNTHNCWHNILKLCKTLVEV